MLFRIAIMCRLKLLVAKIRFFIMQHFDTYCRVAFEAQNDYIVSSTMQTTVIKKLDSCLLD